MQAENSVASHVNTKKMDISDIHGYTICFYMFSTVNWWIFMSMTIWIELFRCSMSWFLCLDGESIMDKTGEFPMPDVAVVSPERHIDSHLVLAWGNVEDGQ